MTAHRSSMVSLNIWLLLCLCDGGRISAEQLYAHFIKETVLAQLHGEVQTGLTAEVGQQRVRMFL